MKQSQEKDLAGCCGLYCGLCPRYQSTAVSRCPGCRVLCQTISCARYNCCVKKRGFETCAECDAFPCERYDKFLAWDSFLSHEVCRGNLDRIKEVGLSGWLGEQGERRRIVEHLLADYNEGRSCSFFCLATTLLSPETMGEAIRQADEEIAGQSVGADDKKAKAKIVRSVIQDRAAGAGIELKLRPKPK